MPRDYVLHSFRAPVGLQIDYARQLNPQQLAAVTAQPGPALVIAGAGAGKTRTLTYRVAFLLEQGVPPESILLLTFTNKAANEMMRRVTELIPHEITALWGGTFHAIGNRVLRRHAGRIGYEPGFTILDRDDAEDLLEACLDEAWPGKKSSRPFTAAVLAEVLSLAANTRQTVRALVDKRFESLSPLAEKIEELKKRYAARKQGAKAMDFDDLLVLWLKLLEEHEDVREDYQRRFHFILVDEYQDTNRLQSDLVDMLAARHRNVMVVGDDSQSIYSWRGANFHNIFKFTERHPEAQVYKIETNYRSTPEILAMANAAIAPNTQQLRKVLVAARKAGAKPVLVACADPLVQARFVAQRVMQLHEEGVGLRNIGVLYRSHFHALELQMELTRQRIPIVITSGARFFEQAHVKDVVAYLRLVFNPLDEAAFKRLVTMLPGIGRKGADKLWARFRVRIAAAPLEQLTPPDGNEPIEDARPACALSAVLRALSVSVPSKALPEWTAFTDTLAELTNTSGTSPLSPSRMIGLVLEAGYDAYIEKNYTNARNRREDLDQLRLFTQDFAGLEQCLSQLALLSNLEAEGELGRRGDDDDRLRLSTVHQAKGLEFAVVFVIMLCEGMFPSHRSMESDGDCEEERRLFYVAATRARDELYLTYPLVRATRASGSEMMQEPSRFITELPPGLLDEWNLVSPYGGAYSRRL